MSAVLNEIVGICSQTNHQSSKKQIKTRNSNRPFQPDQPFCSYFRACAVGRTRPLRTPFHPDRSTGSRKMASNLKKRADLTGYVHSVSQMKTSKTSNIQYFSALLQARDQTWHAFSYSKDKHEQLLAFQASQQAVKVSNAAFVASKRRADTLDVFIDKRATVEPGVGLDFPHSNPIHTAGPVPDESDEYTNISDIRNKMMHRDKVNVCVKVTAEDAQSDVELNDGVTTKRCVFQVADGTGAMTLSVYGKKQIKQIRNMPLVRLKNVVVQVTDGQMSLSTYDATSITSNTKKTSASPRDPAQDQSERCTGLMTCQCSLCKKTDPEVSSQMPCWYFEKNELQYTPSFFDGVDPDTEARYRREGARFILDTGTKMGLKFDSCATGVVYFHRFYMAHSFREFNRYVTGACCLFLAGKVEETPKKCKDIIKSTREMLSENQFAAFGDDPKEEVMTLERILLQTIKFDLRVEHPYSYILKYAKQIKGDKDKVQKLIQMAWTFINDSMCTTLCLQWESDMIAVALMYLAGRLTKYDITDWQGKVLGSKKKWWDSFVEDATMDLLEDICHQVLDLYSAPVLKRDTSPPLPRHDPQQMMAAIKEREQQLQQQKQQEEQQQQQQQHHAAKRSMEKSRSLKDHNGKKLAKTAPPTAAAQVAPPLPQVPPTVVQTSAKVDAPVPPQPPLPAQAAASVPQNYAPFQTTPNYSQSNFISASSFMSGEGAQSLRNLMGSYPSTSTTAAYTPPAAATQYAQHHHAQHPYPYHTPYQAAHYQQPYAQTQAAPAQPVAAQAQYYNTQHYYHGAQPGAHYAQQPYTNNQYTYPATTQANMSYAAPAPAPYVQTTSAYPTASAYPQQPAAPAYAGQPAPLPQSQYTAANSHYPPHQPNDYPPRQ